MTLIAGLVGQRDRVLFRMCPYCGRPTSGAACRSHRDLYDLEQAALAEDPYEQLRQPSAVGSTTKE